MKTLISPIRLILACLVVAVCRTPGHGQVNATLSGRATTGAAIKTQAARAEFKAVTISNRIFTVLALDASTRTIINNLSTTRRVVVHHFWACVPIPASVRNDLGVGVTTNPNALEQAGGSVRAPPAGPNS